jgi:serine/threonine-protein kinase
LFPGSRLPSVHGITTGDFLGGGGFAEAYLAHDTRSPRSGPLSLKVSFHPEGRRLLRHEAFIHSRVAGRGILPLLETFVDADSPVLLYPAVAGQNLRELLDACKRRGRVPEPRWVAVLLRRLATGLAGLHRSHFAHRDVKPSNIMIGRCQEGRRELVLLDLGISGPIMGLSEDDWPHGVVSRRFIDRMLIYSHSRVYASPEQLQYCYERGYTRASDDIYSAGVVAIHALTGWHRRLEGVRWQDQLVYERVPWSFIDLLEACVACDPRQRLRDGGELAERVERVLREPVWRMRV